MKFIAVLMLAGCALAATVPKPGSEQAENHALEILKQSHPVQVQNRNWLIDQAVNLVVNQAINFLRSIINNGSNVFGIPPLDPLELDHFHLLIPAGLINLDMELEDVVATGFGGFVTHRSNLNIRTLLLQLDIRFPLIEIRSKYDLTGDLFSAIPLYGKGDAEFIVENFRFSASFYLRQSDDGDSVVIDRIENIAYDIPSFKSNLTGVIGGGNVDAIVNAIVEEVFIGYVMRFQGAISLIAGKVVVMVLNPVLDSLNTWRFLAPFV